MRPLLAIPVLALATACKVTDQTNFESAPEAVLTFQAKFAREDVAGELACFSQRFREQSGGLSLQGYATVRDRFLAPLGWLGRLVLCYDSLEDNLVRVEGGGGLHVRLFYSLFGHAFVVDAAPEADFKFPDPHGIEMSAPLVRGAASLAPRGASPRILAIEWNMPADAAHQLEASGLPWAELANEWRLEGVTPLEETPKEEPPPAPPAPRPTRVIPVPSIPVHALGTTFGSVRLRVELDLGDAAALVRTLPDGTLLVADEPGAPRLRWEARAADPR